MVSGVSCLSHEVTFKRLQESCLRHLATLPLIELQKVEWQHTLCGKWPGSALWDSSDILGGECIMGQQ